jgi:hypothetical protein
MIGKAEWFGRRKYGGWGIRPITWQAWVYIAAFMTPFLIFQSLPFWNNETRIIITAIWLGILLIDTLDIMRKMKLDEREKIHEAISERNALWGVLVVLIAGIFYDLVRSGLQEKFYVNPFLAGALVIAVVIKAISNAYLEKKKQVAWRFGFAFIVLVAGIILEMSEIGKEFLGFSSVGNWLIYVGFIMIAIITLQFFSKKERVVDERLQFIAMKAGRVTFLAIIFFAFLIMVWDGIRTIYIPYSYFMSYWIAGIVFVYFIAYKIIERKN